MQFYILRIASDVLDCDLFQILVPILVEADFFLALSIKLAHDTVEAVLES